MSPVRLPEFDPIEFLVLRRFPTATMLKIPPSLSGPVRRSPDTRELRTSVEAYRKELRALQPGELNARVLEERGKVAEETQIRHEREEQERFFNQPWANADFTHWSKA